MRKSFLYVILSLVFMPSFSSAGLGSSLMQTAMVTEVGKFEAKIQNDIIFNRGGGFNITAHLQTGIYEPFVDIDLFLGTGTTDFQIGFLGKYNLFPDLPSQFGFSFLGGFRYLRDPSPLNPPDISGNYGLMTLGVLASKNFQNDFGDITPYTSFQFEYFFNSTKSVLPLTLLFGSKVVPLDLNPWAFFGEFSLSIQESHFALSIGAAYQF